MWASKEYVARHHRLAALTFVDREPSTTCAPSQARCARLRGSGDEHDLFESRAPKAPVALHLRLAALAFVDRETSTTCLKVGRRRRPLRSISRSLRSPSWIRRRARLV